MTQDSSNGSPELDELTSEYPPPEHFIRDCGQWVDWDGEVYTAGMRAAPHISAKPGGVRAGIWASLADLIGGAVATRAIRPNWIATSDLSVHLFSPLYEGELQVAAHVLRQGRRTIIIEVDFFAAGLEAPPIGMATLGFSVLKARGGVQQMRGSENPFHAEFSNAQKPLEQDILKRLGVETLDATQGQIRLHPSSYSSNTLGAVQGGVLALLADEAGQLLARQEAQAEWVTQDLALHYLALGKSGPLETRARLLNRNRESALVRVEILDRGEGDRRVLAATLRVGAHDPSEI
jgi:uncharacterized protein (TIGR00369 family)